MKIISSRPITKVAHLRSPFLMYSETFIYNFLKHARRHQPIVLSMQIENEDVFPFSDVYHMHVPRLVERAWNRVSQFESSILKYLPWYPAHLLALKQQSINAIHAHFGTTGYFALPLKQALRLPQITSFYGADVTRIPLQPGWSRRYARLFASSDQFTTNSQLMKDRLVKLGCPEERITIIRTGVDLSQFTYQPRVRHHEHDTVKFLIVARLVEKKGVEYAIRAFARVYAEHPCTELRIIGDGPLRQHLEKVIAELGVGRAVKLLGFQPHSVFVEETQKCHILVQTSVTAEDGDQEGVPVTMVEAHAAGMPIIASRHSGNPEAMIDGETGFLTPERDVDAIASRMKSFIEHPENWNVMGKRGREFVEMHYDAAKETKKLESVYERAVKAILVLPIMGLVESIVRDGLAQPIL